MYYNKILGGIVGDIIGSTRERKNVKNENFELLPEGSCFTDDTVMTLAVAEWLMTDPAHSERALVECMQRLGRKYPNAGYGGMFRRWLSTDTTPLITHRFPLSEIEEAYRIFENKLDGVIKVAII